MPYSSYSNYLEYKNNKRGSLPCHNNYESYKKYNSSLNKERAWWTKDIIITTSTGKKRLEIQHYIMTRPCNSNQVPLDSSEIITINNYNSCYCVNNMLPLTPDVQKAIEAPAQKAIEAPAQKAIDIDDYTPLFISLDNESVNEDEIKTFKVTVSHAIHTSVSFEITDPIPSPTWVDIYNNGDLTADLIMRPTQTEVDIATQYTFTIKATDPDGNFSEQNFTITIVSQNNTPTFTVEPAALTTLEQDETHIYNIELDDDSANVTFTLTTSPVVDWLALTPVTQDKIDADGKTRTYQATLNGTPTNDDILALFGGTSALDLNYGGVRPVSVTITATDDEGESSSQNFTINVKNKDDMPSFDSVFYSQYHNTTVTLPAGEEYVLDFLGDDIDGQPFLFDIDSVSNSGFPLSLVHPPEDIITNLTTKYQYRLQGTPSASQIGTWTVTFVCKNMPWIVLPPGHGPFNNTTITFTVVENPGPTIVFSSTGSINPQKNNVGLLHDRADFPAVLLYKDAYANNQFQIYDVNGVDIDNTIDQNDVVLSNHPSWLNIRRTVSDVGKGKISTTSYFLRGTPIEANIHENVKLSITDITNSPLSTDIIFDIIVIEKKNATFDPEPALGTRLPNASIGSSYSTTITATNDDGTATYLWYYNLPDWMDSDQVKNPVIGGVTQYHQLELSSAGGATSAGRYYLMIIITEQHTGEGTITHFKNYSIDVT